MDNVIKNYIASISELHGEKVKLCDYFSDPDSQLILARHWTQFDKESYKFFFSGANLSSAEDFIEYLKSYEENCKVFIIKDLNDTPVGVIGMQHWKPFNGVNIFYAIAKSHWGNGYALDATKTIIKNFYENKITTSILIGAEAENTKSLRVIEKLAKELGFDDFSKNEKTEEILASNYKLEQKTIDFELVFETCKADSDYILFAWHSSDKRLTEKSFRRLKRFINPELLEKGQLELKGFYCFLTPIY